MQQFTESNINNFRFKTEKELISELGEDWCNEVECYDATSSFFERETDGSFLLGEHLNKYVIPGSIRDEDSDFSCGGFTAEFHVKDDEGDWYDTDLTISADMVVSISKYKSEKSGSKAGGKAGEPRVSVLKHILPESLFNHKRAPLEFKKKGT